MVPVVFAHIPKHGTLVAILSHPTVRVCFINLRILVLSCVLTAQNKK